MSLGDDRDKETCGCQEKVCVCYNRVWGTSVCHEPEFWGTSVSNSFKSLQ